MRDKITLKVAESSDVEFIFQNLENAAKEQNLMSRFSLTQPGLMEALFSEKAFTEVILAHHGNQSVGFILFSITQRNFNLFNGPGIYIHCIYVQPSFRRIKIGTQLLEHVKKIAKERQCCRIDGVVLKQNQGAIDFCKTIHEAKEVDYIHYMRMEV